MALTGRAALVALIGTLAMLLLRTRNGLILVDGLIAAAIVADIILAASVRQLSFARSGHTRILLGQQGAATLTIEYLSYQVTAAKPIASARRIASGEGSVWPDGGLNEEVARFVSSRK